MEFVLAAIASSIFIYSIFYLIFAVEDEFGVKDSDPVFYLLILILPLVLPSISVISILTPDLHSLYNYDIFYKAVISLGFSFGAFFTAQFIDNDIINRDFYADYSFIEAGYNNFGYLFYILLFILLLVLINALLLIFNGYYQLFFGVSLGVIVLYISEFSSYRNSDNSQSNINKSPEVQKLDEKAQHLQEILEKERKITELEAKIQAQQDQREKYKEVIRQMGKRRP